MTDCGERVWNCVALQPSSVGLALPDVVTVSHTRAAAWGPCSFPAAAFFYLPCFDSFINVIDPLADPSHDIYTLAITTGFMA